MQWGRLMDIAGRLVSTGVPISNFSLSIVNKPHTNLTLCTLCMYMHARQMVRTLQ